MFIRQRQLHWFRVAIFPLLTIVVSGSVDKTPALGPETLVSTKSDGGQLRCAPSVAAAGDNVVVAWNESYGGRHGSPAGITIGWTLSTDRGKTFTFGGYLPRRADISVQSGEDPVIIADSKGNFLLLFVNWQNNTHHLLLYEMQQDRPDKWMLRSRYSAKSQLKLIDRPSMFLDTNGRLWVTFTTMIDNSQQIALIWSPDRGKTWTEPTIVSSLPLAPKSSSHVFSKGELITVAWVQLKEGTAELWGATSEDSGMTFSEDRLYSDLNRLYLNQSPMTSLWAAAIPGYAIGRAKKQQALYIPNLTIVTSNGPYKTEVVTDLPDDLGYRASEGWLPSGRLTPVFPQSRYSFFATASNTKYGLAVLAYCRQSELALTDVCLSLPLKGGERKILTLNSKSTNWADVPGNPEAAPVQPNFGDYISLAATNDYLVAVWTDGRDGLPRIMSRVIPGIY